MLMQGLYEQYFYNLGTIEIIILLKLQWDDTLALAINNMATSGSYAYEAHVLGYL